MIRANLVSSADSLVFEGLVDKDGAVAFGTKGQNRVLAELESMQVQTLVCSSSMNVPGRK